VYILVYAWANLHLCLSIRKLIVILLATSLEAVHFEMELIITVHIFRKRFLSSALQIS